MVELKAKVATCNYLFYDKFKDARRQLISAVQDVIDNEIVPQIGLVYIVTLSKFGSSVEVFSSF